ncbi:MAG: RNA polymerase sigma factor [Gemmatimonadetes bacterium]|nr:RNA polymerase sigma factor [Gemmatimonadota bacterium]NNM31626.1 RNA polymerase sigma factor [Gemmatimonadota bacterium]
MNDDEVLGRLQRGDRTALEEVIRRYLAPVRALALSVAGNADDADDISQDAFVLCWEKCGDCRGHDAFRGWLMSITRNLALTRVRNAGRRARIAGARSASREQESPETHAAREELRNVMARGVSELTEAQGVVLILKDLEGWSHGEIAAHMDISREMSRRHLSDARRRMRAYLKRNGFPHAEPV